MQQPGDLNTLPRSTLLASVVLFAIAIGSVFLAPERAVGLGVLIWITAVIPAFLLAHARGLGGATLTLAAGMAAIAVAQAAMAALDPSEATDAAPRLPAVNVAVYVGVAVGIVILVELLYRERRKAAAAALIDRATGLPTERYATMVVEQEFAAAERGRPLTVVMFNLDRLGPLNKRFGNPAGDAVVHAFAKVLKSNTRRENLSARLGGGHFLSVLRDADTAAATVFAQRVVDQMRDVPFPWGRQTVSAGIATFEAGMGSHELLLGAADRALFNAKETGRDSLAVAPDREKRAQIARQAAETARGHSTGTADAVQAKPLAFVVDDDAAVRSAIKGMLAENGWRVWDTGNPLTVVERFAALSVADRPAVIVTDVIMPEMTGMRMIEQIAQIDPDVRVAYMSGYVQGTVSWSGLPGASVAVLSKPFKSAELLGAVNDVTGRTWPAPAPAPAE